MPDPTSTASASDVNQTQAGSQTGGAQSGAGSAAQQAGTQTGQSQSAAGESAQMAAAHDPIDDSSANVINLKSLVDDRLNFRGTLDHVLAAMSQELAAHQARLRRNAEDHDQRLRTLSELALANAVSLSNSVNNDAAADASIAKDNVMSHGKALDTLMISERERTLRGGDAMEVLRAEAVALADTIATDVTAKVLAAMAKAGLVVPKA